MKIYFASDHAGFEMKNKLLEFTKSLGFEVEDLGPQKLDPADDYPLLIEKAAMRIFADPEESKAVILGGSGQGEAVVANRFPNVRAAVFYGGNLEVIKLSREHNNANILSIGARLVTEEEAKSALKLWLTTPFSGDKRHVRRLEEIDRMEEALYKTP
ncbi:MAG TPA: RpiB/LacA/LacB family sugar-phosphate isomerase [Candidatus Paceibacterota bacterium]